VLHGAIEGVEMVRSVRDVMWSEALAVLVRTERVHREVFWPSAGGWEPPVDIMETGTGLLIVVALPGVRREDMEFALAEGELLIRGTRRWPALDRPGRVLRIELPHGRFERRLTLPSGNYHLVGADHVDGCLALNLRKHP